MSQINASITQVMAAIAKTGIAKNMRNQQQGFTYRGIEAAMNELNPLLVAAGITVTPKYSDLQISERSKGDGKATRFATVKGSFTFASGDGSFVVSEYYGEAMDSGDKAITKAQSVAFRTALFQQFVVPTVAVDPEVDGDDLFSKDAFDVSTAKNIDELDSVWQRLGEEYMKRQDRTGYAAIREVVRARRVELTSAQS